MAHSLAVGENDAQPLVARQLRERAIEVETLAAGAHERFRIVRFLRIEWLARWCRRAPMSKPDVDREAAQPGTEGRNRFERGQRAPRLEKRLLREIIGERRIAAQASLEIAQPALTTPDELGEGCAVAAHRERHYDRLRGLGERAGAQRFGHASSPGGAVRLGYLVPG